MSEDGPPQLRLDGDGFDEVFVDPDRDAWVTPRWIADAVGEWELDPATNERSHIRAAMTFMLDRGQDGVALARFVGPNKRVWINPPFSRGQVIKFVRAYRHTNFCFLVRMDYSTDWFAELAPFVNYMLVPKNQRVAFDAPPGAKASSTPFPHGLLYKREEDATPEIRALCYRWHQDTRDLELLRILAAPFDTLSPAELQRRFEYEEAEATRAMERAAATREALRQIGT